VCVPCAAACVMANYSFASCTLDWHISISARVHNVT